MFSTSRRIRQNLIFASVLASVSIFALLPSVHLRSQNKKVKQDMSKVLEKGKDFKSPVEITRVKSRIGVIELDKNFSADEDWFKGLVITACNNSKKPVTHISARIGFPRPKGQENKLDFVVPLTYGESPIPTEDGQFLPNTAKIILPGECVELTLSDNEYDETIAMLNDAGFPPGIKKAKVYITTVGFDDGTLWMGGKTYRLDKNNPGRLIPLEKSYSSSVSQFRFVKASSTQNPMHACADEIQQTQRRDCAGNCEAIHVTVGGALGSIATREVEVSLYI